MGMHTHWCGNITQTTYKPLASNLQINSAQYITTFRTQNKEYIIIQNKEFLFKSTFYICTARPSVKLPAEESISVHAQCLERIISFPVYAIKPPEKCNECVWKSVYHETRFLFMRKTCQLNNDDVLRVPHFQRNKISLAFTLSKFHTNCYQGELLN
jgi:hypothetical protein